MEHLQQATISIELETALRVDGSKGCIRPPVYVLLFAYYDSHRLSRTISDVDSALSGLTRNLETPTVSDQTIRSV